MTTATYYCFVDSPVGQLCIQGDGELVTGLYLPEHKGWRGPEATWEETDAPFSAIREQLAEYFTGKRQQFDVPIKMAGTPFQQRVWQELTVIPYGATISYGELAKRVGNSDASRAVGSANGRNPISIIVPCHRVIGSAGKLTGYGGGLDKKQWLLAWEQQSGTASPKQKFNSLFRTGTSEKMLQS